MASDRTDPAAVLAAIVRAIDTATDRAELGSALDQLAGLAGQHRSALDQLLTEIVDRDLAGPPIRSVFFDQNLVDDAIQETVLAVIAGIGTFRGESSFLTWLQRVARNSALQIRRRQQRLSEPVSNEVPDVADWVRRISTLVADEQVVRAALERLGPLQREVIVLRDVEMLTYDEMADRLAVPVGTVRSRLSRARRELSHHLVTGGAQA